MTEKMRKEKTKEEWRKATGGWMLITAGDLKISAKQDAFIGIILDQETVEVLEEMAGTGEWISTLMDIKETLMCLKDPQTKKTVEEYEKKISQLAWPDEMDVLVRAAASDRMGQLISLFQEDEFCEFVARLRAKLDELPDLERIQNTLDRILLEISIIEKSPVYSKIVKEIH